MALRKIRIWPDPALRKVAKPVAEVDHMVQTLASDLFETMYKSNGVGLAATQIAEALRVLVIDLDPTGRSKNDPKTAEELEAWGFPGPRAFINPEIVAAEGELSWEEGCLSLPGVLETVTRRERVVVRALGPDGEEFVTRASGLYAVALQHETDHLDGRVFIEYLSRLKRSVIKRKMEHLKAEIVDDTSAIARL